MAPQQQHVEKRAKNMLGYKTQAAGRAIIHTRDVNSYNGEGNTAVHGDGLKEGKYSGYPVSSWVVYHTYLSVLEVKGSQRLARSPHGRVQLDRPHVAAARTLAIAADALIPVTEPLERLDSSRGYGDTG